MSRFFLWAYRLARIPERGDSLRVSTVRASLKELFTRYDGWDQLLLVKLEKAINQREKAMIMAIMAFR